MKCSKEYRWLLLLAVVSILPLYGLRAQSTAAARSWHYKPQGKDFVTVNGTMRFNRALYGSNTAFRVEAGDLPEFALYLPGMGGNLRLGIMRGDNSKWLIQAAHIKATYRPGSMLYQIQDTLLGKGTIQITVMPLADKEGMLVQLNYTNLPAGVTLCWAYGGATGKKFSRDGDIGADPESSFYLQPEYCRGNSIELKGNCATVGFGKEQTMEAIFPVRSVLKAADAAVQYSPAAFIATTASATPVIAGSAVISGNTATDYFYIGKPGAGITTYTAIAGAFKKADAARQLLANRIQVETPDDYINTLGGALGMAADGIWETPTYLHGAVAWRMRLNAWRGAYVADVLGWHDRARAHFNSYALSQLTTPESGPVVADTALHLARQQEKLGTSLFSSGYICRNPNGDFRPHHYDMNLVFIDQLLRHFGWTGDTGYVKQMWPLLQRHLAWEKRNFDTNNDGLYDAYCCIWASDALQYSGGAVTHSTAYNYYANRAAAQLAVLIGENATPYLQEAEKIYKAIQSDLWMHGNGWYAEFKDALGNQLLHPAAGLWTIYHAIDSKLPDAFQAYQSLRYVDNYIPHIPVTVKDEAGTPYYLLSTTNWQPYTWSLNNVALAENLHTALAYWQGNRPSAAFQLWKSALVESMYMSASPGGFQQLSYYDAARGELYRDFADPIGMAGRTLVEGLFGIVPDALHDTLAIHPGWPAEWQRASLRTPDIQFTFRRKGWLDVYDIVPALSRRMHLKLQLNAVAAQVQQVKVNGRLVKWKQIIQVGEPAIEIAVAAAAQYRVEIEWKGVAPEKPVYKQVQLQQQQLVLTTQQAEIVSYYDPQQVLKQPDVQSKQFTAAVNGGEGAHTFFVLLKQGNMQWWQPVDIDIKRAIGMVADVSQPQNELLFSLVNYSNKSLKGLVMVNAGKEAFTKIITIPAGDKGVAVQVPASYVITGTNSIAFTGEDGSRLDTVLVNWNVKMRGDIVAVNMKAAFNDKVTRIFSNQYLSPRPQSPTLQLPVQGIGNWCYPLTQAGIDDSGLRKAAGAGNTLALLQGVSFATPGDSSLNNILYTSQWDNYPASASVPLAGKAKHAYLLMAGSTNAMQNQIVNGQVVVSYKDGTQQVLELVNPDNWCPIEQDYQENGPAFHLSKPRPPRVYLKTGEANTALYKYAVIKGYSNRAIEGGAATVLDMVLDASKELSSIQVKTIANDVVIGLMAVSLVP